MEAGTDSPCNTDHEVAQGARERRPVDATWERARGWAVSQAVAALAYYTPENNPGLYHEAETWLALALSDDG